MNSTSTHGHSPWYNEIAHIAVSPLTIRNEKGKTKLRYRRKSASPSRNSSSKFASLFVAACYFILVGVWLISLGGITNIAVACVMGFAIVRVFQKMLSGNMDDESRTETNS